MASRARVSRSPVLHELCERYAERAGGRPAGGMSEHREEVGRRLADGLVYDDSLRAPVRTRRWRSASTSRTCSARRARARSSPGSKGPAPRGGAHGINRYVFHRVARERPDVHARLSRPRRRRRRRVRRTGAGRSGATSWPSPIASCPRGRDRLRAPTSPAAADAGAEADAARRRPQPRRSPPRPARPLRRPERTARRCA